ncbi:MAG: AEC family transporter [Parvibaculum sp.]|uniref:AEC family transporter n=1 Tax=Parvibaculum sp. TaxID=2024848 RepID=UPI003C754487
MLSILNSLIPIFLVIGLGFAMRRSGFPGEGIWLPLDQLNYYVLFPALLTYTLAVADLENFDVWPMAWALAAGLLTMVAILVLWQRVRPIAGPEYSSVFQGAVRWNSFVALASIASLYGKEGVALAAVSFAVLVPLANILSVTVLTRHAMGISPKPATVVKLLAKNPLILACVLGIFLNATGIGLPGPLAVTAKVLGDASLTLGLIAVGGGLRIGHILEAKRIVLVTSALKLLVMPAMMMGYCMLFGVTGLPRLVVLICGAVPGATSSYVLARQLGGHIELMASLITGGTILAMLTMPLMLWIFG